MRDWRVLGYMADKRHLSTHTSFKEASAALENLDCGVILPPDDISERVIMMLIRMKDLSKEERIEIIDLMERM